MGKGKKAPGGNLGKAMIRDQQMSRKPIGSASKLHTTEMDDGAQWVKYQSITEQRDLDDFLSTAALAQRDFTAERRNISLVTPDSKTLGPMTAEREEEILQEMELNKDLLRVPRRPKWTRDMRAEELEHLEREAFLEWRRNFAQLQEGRSDLVVTPFERNIEVWRQLWRVVDRSDILVQIVDARNPLLFRCTDLETYVHEIDPVKQNLLLVNKADLLTEEQRSKWADYFEENNIKYVFWSAAMAQAELDEAAEAAKNAEETPFSDASDDESDEESEEDESVPLGEDSVSVPTFRPREVDRRTAIVQREELFALFRTMHATIESTKDYMNVGFVGYPNVGKSSSINALAGTKMVAVAATPGKTKHFQSIKIADDLTLVDCPGLVFPNYAVLKEDLVCNGVLPIDQLRDGVPATALVCNRIPRQLLEATYGLHLIKPAEDEDQNRPPTASELLTGFAMMRGYMKSGHSNADEQRAARVILKDYMNGKLLFCHPPPGMSEAEFNRPVHVAKLNELRASKRTARMVGDIMEDYDGTAAPATGSGSAFRVMGGSRSSPAYINEVDNAFFAQGRVGVHLKGKNPVADLLRAQKEGAAAGGAASSKKHHNARKLKARNVAY